MSEIRDNLEIVRRRIEEACQRAGRDASEVTLIAVSKTKPVLLEINVAKEESKYGFFMEDAEAAIREISTFPHVHIRGLMTIAPFVENPEENREIFKKLYEFAVDIGRKNIDNVTMDVLSMGMTGDYEVAVEEGATMVRVGTGIFGERHYGAV